MKSVLLSLLFAAWPCAATAIPQQCSAVTFTVNGSAQNKNITGIPLTSLDALVAFFQSAPAATVTGPQTLAGTYCQPLVRNPNNAKLQVFFGSILEDRAGWQALGGVGLNNPDFNPEMYSWIRYANNLGYPTLDLDRLGNGKSSHPDPVAVVQAPYEIALYNNLAQQIRAGSTQIPKYTYLIYVGNSYGSQLGAGMASANPQAYDEFLLTGFSRNFQQDFLGVSLNMPAPAAIVDPARFGTLDPGYVTSTSETALTNSFFGSPAQVDFDPAVAHLFFQRRDVVSIGQYASVYGITYSAPAYTGRVFVLDGEQDQAVCGPGSPGIGPASCGSQLAQTKSLFPAADYSYKTVDRTGHAIQLHTSALKVFGIAHQWLAGQSFQGGPPA